MALLGVAGCLALVATLPVPVLASGVAVLVLALVLRLLVRQLPRPA